MKNMSHFRVSHHMCKNFEMVQVYIFRTNLFDKYQQTLNEVFDKKLIFTLGIRVETKHMIKCCRAGFFKLKLFRAGYNNSENESKNKPGNLLNKYSQRKNPVLKVNEILVKQVLFAQLVKPRCLPKTVRCRTLEFCCKNGIFEFS